MITNDVGTPFEINWDRLHLISDADDEFELELLQMLAADVEEQLVALQTAIAQQDATQIKQLAHYVKGAAANVGVNSISAIALELEEKAVGQQFSEAAALVAAMADQQQQLAIYLQEL